MRCDRSRWEYGRGKGEEWVGRHTKLGTRVAGILGGFWGVGEPGWSLSRSGNGGRGTAGWDLAGEPGRYTGVWDRYR